MPSVAEVHHDELEAGVLDEPLEETHVPVGVRHVDLLALRRVRLALRGDVAASDGAGGVGPLFVVADVVALLAADALVLGGVHARGGVALAEDVGVFWQVLVCIEGGGEGEGVDGVLGDEEP